MCNNTQAQRTLFRLFFTHTRAPSVDYRTHFRRTKAALFSLARVIAGTDGFHGWAPGVVLPCCVPSVAPEALKQLPLSLPDPPHISQIFIWIWVRFLLTKESYPTKVSYTFLSGRSRTNVRSVDGIHFFYRFLCISFVHSRIMIFNPSGGWVLEASVQLRSCLFFQNMIN